MALNNFPYRQDIRPPIPEGLGEHIDREFQKVQEALYAVAEAVNALEVRIADLEATP